MMLPGRLGDTFTTVSKRPRGKSRCRIQTLGSSGSPRSTSMRREKDVSASPACVRGEAAAASLAPLLLPAPPPGAVLADVKKRRLPFWERTGSTTTPEGRAQMRTWWLRCSPLCCRTRWRATGAVGRREDEVRLLAPLSWVAVGSPSSPAPAGLAAAACVVGLGESDGADLGEASSAGEGAPAAGSQAAGMPPRLCDPARPRRSVAVLPRGMRWVLEKPFSDMEPCWEPTLLPCVSEELVDTALLGNRGDASASAGPVAPVDDAESETFVARTGPAPAVPGTTSGTTRMRPQAVRCCSSSCTAQFQLYTRSIACSVSWEPPPDGGGGTAELGRGPARLRVGEGGLVEGGTMEVVEVPWRRGGPMGACKCSDTASSAASRAASAATRRDANTAAVSVTDRTGGTSARGPLESAPRVAASAARSAPVAAAEDVTTAVDATDATSAAPDTALPSFALVGCKACVKSSKCTASHRRA